VIDRSRLEDLILARLGIQNARPLSMGDLGKSLAALLGRELSAAESRSEITEAIARLRAGAFVDSTKLALTTSGGKRLAEALGVATLPKVKNWGDFKRRHLVRFFERGPAAATPESLGLALLARKLGLPERSARSESALANAWLAKALGVEGEGLSPFRLRTASLAASLKVPARPKLSEVVRLSIAAVSGARTAAPSDVAEALVARWLTEGSDTAPGAATSSPSNGGTRDRVLDRAVVKVRHALRQSSVRRFGPSKVFIASVWETLRTDPELAGLGEAGFKALLVAAHQRGDLTLARADLVAAMDPADVSASETRHLNATYHFIQDSGEQP
jgi:hypothetical protein